MIPTKEMLAASYELLRLTPPFTRWSLPQASQIKFTVSRSPKFGHWIFDGRHEVRISATRHNQLPTIARTMAHEMAHIRTYMTDPDERKEHGPSFLKACRAICKHHPYWDYAEFIL